MAVLVVDALIDVEDVLHLIEYLTRTLARGDAHFLTREGTVTLTRPTEAPGVPTITELEDLVDRYGDNECCHVDHRDGCSCQRDAASTDPRQGIVVDPPRSTGRVEYVPCGQRGTHERLVDCWMCWSDVHRGVIDEAEALAPRVVEGSR